MVEFLAGITKLDLYFCPCQRHARMYYNVVINAPKTVSKLCKIIIYLLVNIIIINTEIRNMNFKICLVYSELLMPKRCNDRICRMGFYLVLFQLKCLG